MTATLPADELLQLCRSALTGVGADSRDAQILAEATVEAELAGNRAVGVNHLFDYLDGYRCGRIARQTRPVVRRPAAGLLDVDAAGGLAQTAFAAARIDLERTVVDHGIAAAWISHSFTCGELGCYPRRLAQSGFVSVAMANSPALMSVGGSPDSVLGTNPFAYAIPRPGSLPIVIDQASSSTAFVNIRRAAESGDAIPEGWALGPDGQPTRDAAAALDGTLLPFGSHRGGNIALLVEVFATLAGASFSLHAAPFDRGSQSPDIGVFVLGVDPSRFAGSTDRLAAHLDRLTGDHQVRLPALELTSWPASVTVADDTLERLRAALRA